MSRMLPQQPLEGKNDGNNTCAHNGEHGIYHNNSGIALFGINGAVASQQNMILNNVKDRFSADGDNSRVDLSTWQALGFDTHAIVSTPGTIFVSHAARDCRLQTGSPAIESGIVHDAARRERDGVSRPLD
ncbi:MAG: hypothetical protein OSB41_11795, partial [Kiritimatiellae bacterium]|nr:hypothetical protein [Kiritimatiellia bacterium]